MPFVLLKIVNALGTAQGPLLYKALSEAHGENNSGLGHFINSENGGEGGEGVGREDWEYVEVKRGT